MGHTNLLATTSQRGLPRSPRINAGARTCSRVEWSGMTSLQHKCRFEQLLVRLPGVDEEASAQWVIRNEERMTFSLSDRRLLFDGSSEAPSPERVIGLSPVDRRRLPRTRMNPTTPRSSRRLRVEVHAPRRDALLRSRARCCTHQFDDRTVRPLAISHNSELHGVAAIARPLTRDRVPQRALDLASEDYFTSRESVRNHSCIQILISLSILE